MKKVVYIIMIGLIISACTATKEAGISRAEKRQSMKIAEQAIVKKAVESRRFIIRMQKIYTMGGRPIDLVPKNNFIVVDGGATAISLGYVGRNYGIRPISGINLNGQTTKYKLESNEGKGTYSVNMEVKYKGDSFDLYLSIGSDGYCNVSVINSYIQTVSYYGQLIPISDRIPSSTGSTDQI